MKLNDIKEQKALCITEMRALLATAESANRALTSEEATRFETAKAEVTALEASEARASFLAEAERRMVGTPVDGQQRDRAGLEQRVSLLRILQAGMEGRALTGAEAEFHAECERSTGRKARGFYAPLGALETRVNTSTSGAAVVGTDLRPDQFISPLRNALLARRLGVRVLSGLVGNVSIPRQTNDLTIGWVAEGSDVGDSSLTFDSVTLAPKHAGGLTEMSRQLIQQSSPDIEQLVRDDVAAMIAKAIDAALIVGGGSNQPVGVVATTGVQTSSLATLSWAAVLAMIEKADTENAPATSWLCSPAVRTKLASTLKETALPGYLLEGGKMAKLPVYVTNQVPVKTGTPNKLRLILGDWSQMLLGIWSEIDILVNPYEAAAFKRGGVVVRAMSTCDIGCRHPKAFTHADDIGL